jgi:phosphatidate cytidylyltransferase
MRPLLRIVRSRHSYILAQQARGGERSARIKAVVMLSSLQKRIATVLVLVPPLLAALYYLPPSGIAALFGLFVTAGAWEWAALSGLGGAARAVYVVALCGFGAAAVAAAFGAPYIAIVVLAAAACWWAYAPFAFRHPLDGVYRARGGRLIAGFLVLIPAWVAVSVLHADDPRRPGALLFVLVLVAFADTAAYAAGHAFGRTKLAPTISPGKTIEGVVGGLLAVLLLAYFCGTMIWSLQGATLAAWLLLAAVTALVSVVGDLVESKVKRVAGVKDSGNLLPGHGGVLDRIDALTAAAPVYALGWLLWFGARA